MGVFDFIRELFNKDIVKQFNDLIENHMAAIKMFCFKEYTSPELKKQDFNRYKLPNKKSSFKDKVFFVSQKELILENYENQLKYNKERDFKDNILLNFHRSRYYQAFMEDRKQSDKFYCLTHLSQLDQFIYNTVKKEYDLRKKKYPLAVEFFINNRKEDLHTMHSIILKTEDELLDIQQQKLKGDFYINWEKSQVDFSKKCYEISLETFPKWGRFKYEIPFKKYDFLVDSEEEGTFKVWHFFHTDFAPIDNLDYTNFKYLLTNRENNKDFYNLQRFYLPSVYDQIFSFIQRLKTEYENDGSIVTVRFANSGLDSYFDNPKKFNDFHFEYLSKKCKEIGIFNGRIDLDPSKPIHLIHRTRVIIVDLITSKEQLRSICSNIVNSLKDCSESICTKFERRAQCFNDIVYISLRKEYDCSEMQRLIETKKQEIELKKVEEEKKREREKQFAEHKKKQQEEQKRVEEELLNAVSNWNSYGVSQLKAFSLFNYYPTTCNFEANEYEWDIRNLIWDFKAAPTRPTPETRIIADHKSAMNRLLPKIESCLKTFFGENLSKITFVCIPASSQIKTERRFKDFSSIICDNLGMTNAYDYVRVTSDTIAKHLGGTGKSDVTIDLDFFKGKYVLLFDDVITKGNTMLRFAQKLRSAGAIVIGGLSIGQTKHHRSNNPIDIIAHFMSSDNTDSNNNHNDLIPF